MPAMRMLGRSRDTQMRLLGTRRCPIPQLVIPSPAPNRDWMHDRERRGWEAPNQAINPVATLVMSADFAAALAKALAAASKPLKKLR